MADSIKVSLKEAFFTNENYVRASWVNIINIIFHELSGINVIFQYSNTILKQILGDSSSSFTPRQGTYCVSAVNFLSSAASIWTINNFGRRSLLLVGHSAMSIIHILIGTFIITGFNMGTLVGILLFLVAY